MRKNKIWLLVLAVALIASITVTAVNADGELKKSFMPLIFKNGYYPTVEPPTPVPTVTNTPKPTEVPPTPTPTPILAEGGNSCVYILGSGITRDGGTGIGAIVPSVCSFMVKQDVQQDGQLLIVKALRIKTDTWGCQEGDFGPLVTWPPTDYDCPPPEDVDDIIDPNTGQILWGDFEFESFPNSYQVVCGYCEECPEPHTVNCVEVQRPNAASPDWGSVKTLDDVLKLMNK